MHDPEQYTTLLMLRVYTAPPPTPPVVPPADAPPYRPTSSSSSNGGDDDDDDDATSFRVRPTSPTQLNDEKGEFVRTLAPFDNGPNPNPFPLLRLL